MSDLLCLIYVSTAKTAFGTEEIAALLEEARTNNAAHGITGLLLYAAPCFMQYVEGPRENVERLFETLKGDPRHRGIIELTRRPREHRAFDAWSMAYGETPAAELEQAQEQLAALSRDADPASTLQIVMKQVERSSAHGL